MRARGAGALAVVVTALGLLAGCGGDDDDATDAFDQTETTEATGRTDEAASEDESSEDSGGGGSADRCPLTAEQVGEAVGTEMEDESSSCTFFPTGDFDASVVFVRTSPIQCSEEGLEASRLSESFDGLGVEAYTSGSDDSSPNILVCTDTPFDISVSIGTDRAAALAAAEQLARIVLENE